MKTQSLLFTALLPFCLSAQAAEKMTEVEIPVSGVFAPPEGYDDNDNVEVVVEAVLPDTCFRMGRTDLSRQGTQITVHQYALRPAAGNCPGGDSVKIDDDVTVVAPVGTLSAGKYTVASAKSGQAPKTAGFAVAEAKSPSVDSVAYANVTNVDVDSVVKPGKVEIEVNGTLQNSCRELVEPIEVKKLGNVIVVLPTQTHVGPANRLCTFMMRPFRKTVSIDVPDEGRYLVHVRARNGKSINQLVEVKAQPGS